MMRCLTLAEIMELYRRVMEQTGGAVGILNLPGLASALAQPRMAFAENELYPSIVEKASALGFSLIKNHAFTDGNKRAGHAAMETFPVLNGYEIDAPVDDQERVVLQLSSGKMDRDQFTEWLRAHTREKGITDDVVRNPGSSAERG